MMTLLVGDGKIIALLSSALFAEQSLSALHLKFA